ncbi:hypothetical protein AAFF_G00011060 [Aldrovandia affinis]|uniref:Uncharacterized protein n=1 Tax=Aldrovandia affinis TaxID=143900 RepID=A0AAD7S6T4_9TELE|nr:hypothetical protein AAFF_G00011060 [Aldrovandia affinis]
MFGLCMTVLSVLQCEAPAHAAPSSVSASQALGSRPAASRFTAASWSFKTGPLPREPLFSLLSDGWT